MKERRDILKSLKMPTALCFVFVLIFLGCAPEKVTGPTPEQNVMNAQYTTKTKSPPMSGAEADAIYKNYIENIGKPVKPTSGLSDTTPR
jgi:hypothetical protein